MTKLRTIEGRRLKKQLDGLVKAAIAARRFIQEYSPIFKADLIADLDEALKKAGATAAFSDKELAGMPCRDPGEGGCLGLPRCETCEARSRLHRAWKNASP